MKIKIKLNLIYYFYLFITRKILKDDIFYVSSFLVTSYIFTYNDILKKCDYFSSKIYKCHFINSDI